MVELVGGLEGFSDGDSDDIVAESKWEVARGGTIRPAPWLYAGTTKTCKFVVVSLNLVPPQIFNFFGGRAYEFRIKLLVCW